MTDKQAAFVTEYLKSWNATRAALAAGYSPDTAYSIGSENLKKPEIKAAIQERIAQHAMTGDEALHRLAEQARNEGTTYLVVKRGHIVLDVKRLVADGKAHLIKSITYNSKGKQIIEFHDAQSALTLIGRHWALFMDKQASGEGMYREHMEGLRREVTAEDGDAGNGGA